MAHITLPDGTIRTAQPYTIERPNLLLKLHEKAAAALEMYQTALQRQKDAELYSRTSMLSTEWYKGRVKANAAIAKRLAAYYANILNKINQQK